MKTTLILILVLSCLAVPASASSLINGTLYYYNLTPNNDPLELYVMQGDTLYLGKTYDLTGVEPITHLYAHWNKWKDANTNCNPDKVVDTWYIRTFTNEKAVWFDPAKWAVGDWYRWDPIECNRTHYDYSKHEVIAATEPIQADNKFAFTIMRPPRKAFPILGIPSSIPEQTYEPVYELSSLEET